jgi:hypothetical protein
MRPESGARSPLTRRIYDAMTYAMSRRELHDASFSFAKGKLGKLVESAEVGAGLFGWGLVNGRFGVIAPLGISLDLMVGLALGAAGVFDLGGNKVSPHVMNFANASLGSFLMRKGVQTGSSMRTAAGLPALAAADLGTGIFGGDFARGLVTSGGSPRELTDAELAAMSVAARR